MPKISKKLRKIVMLNKEILNVSLSSEHNVINLGKNCLDIRKGVGQSFKKQSKILKKITLSEKNKINKDSNLDYGAFFWEENERLGFFENFTFEDSLPCVFAIGESLKSEFSFLRILDRKRNKSSDGAITEFTKALSPVLDVFGILKSLNPSKVAFTKEQKLRKFGNERKITFNVSRVLTMRMSLNKKKIKNKKTIERLGLVSNCKPFELVMNKLDLNKLRYKTYYDALVAKEYYRVQRRLKSYPFFQCAKRSVLFAHVSRTFRRTIAKANIAEQYERHPTGQFQSLKKYLITTINAERFEKFEYKTKSVMSYTNFYKTVWRYFKLKLERFFYKKLGVRMHVWFMNIWDIFMTGIDSYWRWFKFEDQKIFAMTRKGQRYLIEGREEAKFYLRSMALTLTFGGGVKLFINKVTEMLRQYRNNWAFITYTMESLRLCGNFFWFRFFLNYKITLQGKIGGILRAAKKTFKKGDVTIEDRSTVVVHQRTFPQSKFGTYCLGFWMQYRVPNLIGTFDELEYIDTMRVLLSMYTIPWLSTRLTEIIEAILREQEIKKQIKFSQYNRRQRARGILAAEFKRYIKRNKIVGKMLKKKNKQKKAKN